jgi:lysophospholipase L1-like esterase
MSRVGKLITPPMTAFSALLHQVYGAIHRADLPSYVDQDPTGDFGSHDVPPLQIVILGDSSVTAPGIDIDESWGRRVAIHLCHRYHVRLRSVAVGGSKARDLQGFQLDPAIAIGGDMALISIGANDAMRGTPVARFERELDAALARLQPHFPMIGVSGVGDLGTLPRLPPLAQTIARTRARSVDHAIRRVVHDHPGVVKGYSWGPAWVEFDTDPDGMFSGDLFHASERGHELFANAAINVAEALLAARGSQGISGSPESLESTM